MVTSSFHIMPVLEYGTRWCLVMVFHVCHPCMVLWFSKMWVCRCFVTDSSRPVYTRVRTRVLRVGSVWVPVVLLLLLLLKNDDSMECFNASFGVCCRILENAPVRYSSMAIPLLVAARCYLFILLSRRE